MLGHQPDALLGTAFLDLVHVDDVGAVGELFTMTGEREGSTHTTTARLRDGAGGYRDVETVCANRLHDRAIQGYVLNLRDTTERRRLDRERRSLALERLRADAARAEVDLLRERVEAQRERQELEMRLRRSQRLQSIGQLAGGVAHDFNNLLAVILNYAGFVRDQLPAEAALHRDVAQIEEAARRGARLTRQLLTFAQRKVTAPEVLEINAVIENLDHLLTRSVGANVTLRYELRHDITPVEADPGGVEQILINLVVNARDALAPDGGVVTISTSQIELEASAATDLEVPPGAYVQMTVHDDGCGMDDATLARAFEPFFTTKPAGQGTGLGLATVYGIASQAGGCVTLESPPGDGTTVALLFPASDRAPNQDGDEAGDPTRASTAADGERILLVEDDDAVRSAVERMLVNAGYRVVTAESGDAALEIVDLVDPGFDLMLTDMVMPGISGGELAKHLRALRPQQRIAFMTGYSTELLTSEQAAPGPVLVKPFRRETLLAVVRETLDATSTEASSLVQPA